MFEDNSQNNRLQLIGKLNASFVHEIRNPLYALKLNLDYLKLVDNLPEDAKESINSCTEAIERIQFLIENILDFSRKTKSQLKKCSLNEITSQAIDLVEGYAAKKRCSIRREQSSDNIFINIDRNKLLQVLLNLITNAVDASKDSQPVIIRTYKESSKTVWEIEDFGHGIKDEDKGLIFTDFFTKKKNGTGLGLSICKDILDEYKVEIGFDSNINKGSRFFIKFNSTEK